MNEFDFRELFVLDLANNHQGSVDHGRRIIREMGEVVRAHGVRAGFKFQFRELDTFIHPAHRAGEDNKHIKRFLSTRLAKEDFAMLTDEVRKQDLIPIATPFDEASVDLIEELNIDVIKIGSCSATDWPLIEKIAETSRPVIFSTGGLTLKQIDALVSFFEHRKVQFAVMHCVSIYPTPYEQLQLSQIELLRNRYPGKPIGFSTHEHPDSTAPIQIAVAKRAELFERHVGVETESIKLNAYSSTPQQIDRWLLAYKEAKALCGVSHRPEALPEELSALDSLKRGVYARKPLRNGVPISQDDVYFAMPLQKGQLEAGEWKNGIVSIVDVEKDEAFKQSMLQLPQDSDKRVIYSALHVIKAMLNDARIELPTDFKLEISHHYGLKNFMRYGATLIECVNRGYCKKLIVQLPNQRHPAHFHRAKEETFQVLYGVLELELDGRRKTLYPGETVLIMQGVWHQFWNETGVIVEEISTTHYNNDSFYADKTINRMERSARKTIVDHWGRFQL
jgi:N-acetylneuraminate synthase